MDTIKLVDFFCGVGGVRLGFEQASGNYQCVFSNDIDTNAIKTYETNFQSHKVESKSITDINAKDIPNFDIFLGGFPCQSFSVAGNLKGFDDARGNLFFDIIRILKEKQPKAFFLENVKNLSTHDKGNTIKRIKQELNDIGYTFKIKVLNTCEYGNLPQNRERVYLVGFLNPQHTKDFTFPHQIQRTRNVLDFLEENIPNKYYYTSNSVIYPKLVESVVKHINTHQVYQYRRHYVRANCSNVCPTLTANMGGGGHNVPIIKDDKGIRKLTPRECFNLQGFPRNYKLPQISDTQLYKQAGNSVSINVIKRLAISILQVLSGNKFAIIDFQE